MNWNRPQLLVDTKPKEERRVLHTREGPIGGTPDMRQDAWGLKTCTKVIDQHDAALALLALNTPITLILHTFNCIPPLGVGSSELGWRVWWVGPSAALPRRPVS